VLQAAPDGDRAAELQTALDSCRGMLELIVAKQRSGPLETVRIGFDGATNSLFEWDEGGPIPDRHEGLSG
jgi:replicative DNA helicase